MSDQSLATLRRLVRPRDAEERCDLCGAAIAADHRHLFDSGARTLACSCQACSLLFSGGAAGRYLTVPSRVLSLRDFQMSDERWDELLVPVNLAFFSYRSDAGRMTAHYPSPAGATESQLGLDTWRELAAANPVLESLQPDVEALLVNRVGSARDHLIVPIDECFRLVGLVRAGWRGLSGGTDVWKAVAAVFTELRARARDA
jgi:hypothetical protein